MVHKLKDNMIGTESYKRHIKFPLTPDLTSQSITYEFPSILLVYVDHSSLSPYKTLYDFISLFYSCNNIALYHYHLKKNLANSLLRETLDFSFFVS